MGVQALQSGAVIVRFGAILPTRRRAQQGPTTSAGLREEVPSLAPVLTLNRTIRTMTSTNSRPPSSRDRIVVGVPSRARQGSIDRGWARPPGIATPAANCEMGHQVSIASRCLTLLKSAARGLRVAIPSI